MTQAIEKNDFLFELGCEELPPKALVKLADSLKQSLQKSFDSVGLNYVDCEYFATPRRLAVRFNQLDCKQADQSVEKLGPAVAAAYDANGNPKPAAIGFAKSNGVKVDQLSKKQTDKGERLAFIAQVKGQDTLNLINPLIIKAINQLPLPKAMRWGDCTESFSRPVHWVLAILGKQVLTLELFGLKADRFTLGHRFHHPEAIEIKTAAEYETKLEQAKVVVCFEARKAKIRMQTEQIAKEMQAHAVISEDLLEEVTALVEWPVALAGHFDKAFLKVPAEALISSMAEHQKYFHLVDDNQQLLAAFITISNIDSLRPASVVEGNEKVIRPRLADAKFFYDSDCAKPLESHINSLKKIVFQNKLGSLFDKSQRVAKLSSYIANELGQDPKQAVRAAQLCKCDLMTDMVGEFSDLQGIMGKYYALKDGEDHEVAAAMDEVYMPRFAGDQLPTTQTGLILALADRLDTLVGIFGIGQIPTGTKDPFALRRSALGVLRLITENHLSLSLNHLVDRSIGFYSGIELEQQTNQKLASFFQARASGLCQDKGYSLPAIKSVEALDIQYPTDFIKRVEAVENFKSTSESQDLAEANKRVKNILSKSELAPDSQLDTTLFGEEEKALYQKICDVKESVGQLVSQKDYSLALQELAQLKDVVNIFFDKVMINAEDPKMRKNRLSLISQLRQLFLGIADISLLQK